MESCSFRFNGKDCHISYENVGDDRICVDMLYVDAYFYDDCEIFFTPKEKTFTKDFDSCFLWDVVEWLIKNF